MSTSKRAKGGGGHDRHNALLVPPQALRDYAFLADGYGAIIEVGPTIRQVADYLLIRHHSAVELIDRCERAGLVERERDADDRRVMSLRLSPDGDKILADLSGANLEELARLTPLFEAMLDALGTPTDR